IERNACEVEGWSSKNSWEKISIAMLKRATVKNWNDSTLFVPRIGRFNYVSVSMAAHPVALAAAGITPAPTPATVAKRGSHPPLARIEAANKIARTRIEGY